MGARVARTGQEARVVRDDLRLAFAFVATGDMGGARREVSRLGLAVFDQALPLRYDSNYLLVDELPEAASADDLAGEARRLDRPRSWCATSRRASGWFLASSSWTGRSIADW